MKPRKITKNFITAYNKSKYRRIYVENERLKKSTSNPNTILLPKSVFLTIVKNSAIEAFISITKNNF